MLARRRLVGLGLAAMAVGGTALLDGSDTLFAQGDAGVGGTGTLAGQVTDVAGSPLAGATVMLLSPSLEAGDLTLVTDGGGRFSLAPAPAGLYDVQAEHGGFRTGVLGAVPVEDGKVAQVTPGHCRARTTGRGGRRILGPTPDPTTAVPRLPHLAAGPCGACATLWLVSPRPVIRHRRVHAAGDSMTGLLTEEL
jgi:hypothetical protein